MFRQAVAQHYRAKGYEVRENVKVRGASGNIHQVALVAEGGLGALVVSFGDAGGMDPSDMGSIRRIAKDVGATPVLAAPGFPPEFRRQAAQHGVVLLDESFETQAPAFPEAPSSTPWPGLQGGAALDRSDLEAHPWPPSGRARTPEAGGLAPSEVDDLVASWERRAQAERAERPPQEGRRGAEVWSEARPAVPEPMPRAPSRFSWLGARAPPPPAPQAPADDVLEPGGPLPLEDDLPAAEHASIVRADGPLAVAVRRRKAVPAPAALSGWQAWVQVAGYAALTALFVYLLLRLA